MANGIERDELLAFHCQHHFGNKYVYQYHIEDIEVPGTTEPRTIIRRINNGKFGQIDISRDQLFDAIDEWHRGNGHMGQERTWVYCRDKYHNVTQAHVKIYCETCLTCMKKNPVSRIEKGSQKPILSRSFWDRFQIDLVDFRKLRKQDPFGVLMHWVMTIKDHATRLIHLCALPWKHPNLVAYKLQEIFGTIGYPKIFHTDNGKEFTVKSILTFLCEMNPNVLTVTGQPQCPCDQGSVKSVNKLVKRVLGSVLAE